MFDPSYFNTSTEFKQTYRCFPVSMIDKPDLEAGGKIVLPPSALQSMSSMQLTYPLLFELKNYAFPSRKVHCGVLEFVADEGQMFIPYWLMQNLAVTTGDFVSLRTISLPKASFVKFQPQSKEFLDITNPKAVLENVLRNFSALTIGESIMINYNHKQYFLTVLELQPTNTHNAVSVIETDVLVDFSPPPDMESDANVMEEEIPPVQQTDKKRKSKENKPGNKSETLFPGSGKSLSGKMSAVPQPATEHKRDMSGYESDTEDEEDDDIIDDTLFAPFSGPGYSLKG